MKQTAIFCLASFGLAALTFAQGAVDFDRYFVDQTMRVDYFHVGNAKEEMITLDQVRVQGVWAGSRKNLLDDFDDGRTAVKIRDLASGKLIFSRGFDTYFGEYQTTDAALKGARRTYHESALIPCPKAKITFTVETRDRKNDLHPLFSCEIDPAALTVLRKPLAGGVKVFELLKNGEPRRSERVHWMICDRPNGRR